MLKNIDERIIEIINSLNYKEVQKVLITNNTNLFKDLGFDSIMIVQLVAYIEDEFNIVFEDDELDIKQLSYYENIKNIVLEKVSSRMK